MRSVWITRTGPPEALEVRDGPEPTPGPGQALVRVRAAGVNFADVMARLGLYPDAPPRPCVVGYEVAGTVERLGPGADGALATGQGVIALTRFGGYAEAVPITSAPAMRQSWIAAWPTPPAAACTSTRSPRCTLPKWRSMRTAVR